MIVSVKTELNEEHRFVNEVVYWGAKHLAILSLYSAQKHARHTSKQFTQPDLTFVEKSTCPLWSRGEEPAVVEKTPVTISGCEGTQNAAVTVLDAPRVRIDNAFFSAKLSFESFMHARYKRLSNARPQNASFSVAPYACKIQKAFKRTRSKMHLFRSRPHSKRLYVDRERRRRERRKFWAIVDHLHQKTPLKVLWIHYFPEFWTFSEFINLRFCQRSTNSLIWDFFRIGQIHYWIHYDTPPPYIQRAWTHTRKWNSI